MVSLVARKQALAIDLKRMVWLRIRNDQPDEGGGKEQVQLNTKVANSYGKDAMLELAQMAEIQGLRYKNTPANAKDGRPRRPGTRNWR